MANLCTRFINAAAARLAQDPRIPVEARQAFRDAAQHVLRQQMLALLPERGADTGCLRFYPPSLQADERQQRDQRIRALLAAGVTPEQVAAEVGCSRAHAYRTRAAMRRVSHNAP